MSVYRPTFVNWDKEASQPVGGAGGMAARKASPAATDLHIKFSKGGITVKDMGAEAVKSEFVDANGNPNNSRQFVRLTFPAGTPINSSPYVAPAKLQPNGTVDPPSTKPLPGTSTKPTFEHPDPSFPAIEEWWWTKDGRRTTPKFTDPDPPPKRPRRRAR
jgi:hypothetical protein